MLSHVTTLCFVASYALALLLEGLRLRWQSPWRRVAAIGWAVAGIVAHTAFLAHRASLSGASPLSSPFDWCLLVAWLLALVYLLQTLYYPRFSVGLFVLPLVLILIGAAQLAAQEPFAAVRADRLWSAIHGSFLLLGTVAVLVGFVSAVMYLVQSYRLKHKLPPGRGFRLPSLEWLERINSRSLAMSAMLVGVGLASGLLLNQITHRDDLGYLLWSDPAVLSLSAMFLWLVAAELFRLAYRPARQGRKLAYLNVASFGFLAMTLAALLLLDSAHRVQQGSASRLSGGVVRTDGAADAARRALHGGRGERTGGVLHDARGTS